MVFQAVNNIVSPNDLVAILFIFDAYLYIITHSLPSTF